MIALGSRQWLIAALAATLLFRLWLAAAVPVTADEAYFILWGRAPALGFYDHPPMVGWLLAPLAALTDAAWLLRLPAVLVPPLAALAVAAALRFWFGRDEDTASLAALAVLLVPVNVWNVFITTDTPLVLFSVASLLAFARAAEKDSASWFLLSGALLGLAFLSKYFAVLLALAFLVWSIFSRRPGAFLLVVAGALPFGLVNLYWNYEACWCNVMFNAINRHEADDSGWSLTTPALYALSLAYVGAPFFWFAWRGRERLRAAWRQPGERALLLAWLVPFAAFALLSPVKRIGLHWLLSFVPALVLSAALAFERRQLALSVRVLAILAVLHAVPLAVVTALPLDTWKATRFYQRLAFPGRIEELLAAVAPDAKDRVLAADSYAAAALLEFRARRPIPVFGEGTSHARQSDLDTDWRALAGKDVVVLKREKPPLQDFQPYFRSIEVKAIPLGGGTYHAVLGRGFDYEAYRTGVLAGVRQRYYRIPQALPIGRCYFFERYFPRMKRALAVLELLRPHQWIKNAFVLVGLVFGHAWREPSLVIAVALATAAFCLASGAVYAFNDARDAPRDREHPDKRSRPVARGALTPVQAMAVSVLVALAALALAASAGWKVAAIVAVYLAVSAAYSMGLKHVPVADVVLIAAGFMLRLLAGTAGVGIAPSVWLLACGFLLTLFLGFAKRRAELERLAGDAGRHRAVLESYTTGFLDKTIFLCALGMIAAYTWYTLAIETALLHGTRWLVLTVPWVLLGTARYLYRLRQRGGGGDPALEVVRDPLLGAAIAGWLATVLWLIG